MFKFMHKFKNLYHNFMNKWLMHPPTLCHEHIFGNKCIAQFAHLKQLYCIEEGKPLKVAMHWKKYPSAQVALPRHYLNMLLVS